ncbi:hypothetical protein DFH08DRAFT_993498 [Mycena albidolilacea]|uniref:Uncharacterized protein n=1 Tax=Mycena albidolilacea TaxID=1033008 RepID=A0AAD7E761_9AGAR|nr:hypothetical protein DFH08DRAFT_993498 [Mycena albidolilacea]
MKTKGIENEGFWEARQSDGIWPLHARMKDARAPANEFMSKYTNLGKRSWLMKIFADEGNARGGRRTRNSRTVTWVPSRVPPPAWDHLALYAFARSWGGDGPIARKAGGTSNAGRLRVRMRRSARHTYGAVKRAVWGCEVGGRRVERTWRGAYGGRTGVASMVSDGMWSGGGTRSGGCLSRGGASYCAPAVRVRMFGEGRGGSGVAGDGCGCEKVVGGGARSRSARGKSAPALVAQVAGGARRVGSARQAEASRPLLVAREQAWAESCAMRDERRVPRMREVVHSERGMHMRRAPRATKTVGRCEKATEGMWAARDADIDAVHAVEGARMSCVRRRGVERVSVAQGREWARVLG